MTNERKKKGSIRRGKVVHLPPRLRATPKPVQIGQIIVDGFHSYLEQMNAETFIEQFEIHTESIITDAQLRYGGGELIEVSFFKRKVWDMLPPQVANMELLDSSMSEKVRGLIAEISRKLHQHFVEHHQWDH